MKKYIPLILSLVTTGGHFYHVLRIAAVTDVLFRS